MTNVTTDLIITQAKPFFFRDQRCCSEEYADNIPHMFSSKRTGDFDKKVYGTFLTLYVHKKYLVMHNIKFARQSSSCIV